MTWLETSFAFGIRDGHIAWLERRLSDLERTTGNQGISLGLFEEEHMQAMHAQQTAAAQQQEQAAQQPAPQQEQRPPEGQNP
jgi:hypothetical protein